MDKIKEKATRQLVETAKDDLQIVLENNRSLSSEGKYYERD